MIVISDQNVELVRNGFEHFVATGEPAWDTLHEHVEVRDHDIMDGREYRGHADVRRWLFEDWASAWSDYSAEPEEFIDVDDELVIAVFRMKATGRSSGVEIERQDAIVCSCGTGGSFASTTTTASSRPSKPWAWMSEAEVVALPRGVSTMAS